MTENKNTPVPEFMYTLGLVPAERLDMKFVMNLKEVVNEKMSGTHYKVFRPTDGGNCGVISVSGNCWGHDFYASTYLIDMILMLMNREKQRVIESMVSYVESFKAENE